jgi:phosphotransacetylase
MIKSSQEIIEAARRLSRNGNRLQVAVAVAQDADILGAVRSAYDDGICDATLIGDGQEIEKIAKRRDIDLENLEIMDQPDQTQAVVTAAELAANDKVDVLMKGFVPTTTLLKAILDRRHSLLVGPTLSHVAVLDIPAHHKLLMLTDGGVVVKPSIKQKLEILKNSVRVGKTLEIDPVKVALSAAADTVVDAMSQTKDDARLLRIIENEDIEGCHVAGPMSFDLAISAEIAAGESAGCPVAGDADVYLVGTIEECNILAKSMIIFAKAVVAGVIVGAKIPISLVSRTEPVESKKTSIALACLISEYYRRTGWEM